MNAAPILPSQLKDRMLKALTKGRLIPPCAQTPAVMSSIKNNLDLQRAIVEGCALIAHCAWTEAQAGLGHTLVRGCWRMGEFVIERETGRLWKIIDVDIGCGRILLEPPWCKNRSDDPEAGGELVWQGYETREARWTQEGLTR